MWRAETHNGAMYIGTNDASSGFANVPGARTQLQPEFGLDLWGTCDGQYWWQVTRNAFGDGRWNFGARTIVSSPSGLFIGSTNHVEGTSVWLGDASPCGAPVPFGRGGGVGASSADATSPAVSPPPRRLLADTQKCGTVLSWDATSGATRYRILRSEYRAVDVNLGVQPRINGQVLSGASADAGTCGKPLEPTAGVARRSVPDDRHHEEELFRRRGAKPGVRYTYQVVALGAPGTASQPSNTATVPSQTASNTFGQLNVAVQRLIDSSNRSGGAVKGSTLLRLATVAQASWQKVGPNASLKALDRLRTAAGLSTGAPSRVATTVAMTDVQDAILRLERRASLHASM